MALVHFLVVSHTDGFRTAFSIMELSNGCTPGHGNDRGPWFSVLRAMSRAKHAPMGS